MLDTRRAFGIQTGMPAAHEQLEHAEHAAHAGHHDSSNTYLGVTMAIIGAMIAFCAAMVGSERNELTRTLIQQTQAHADYASSSTKYRLTMLEIEKERGRIGDIGTSGTTAAMNPAESAVVRRFVELASHYYSERKIFGNFLNSYSPLVDTYFESAEGYERAQLIAEIAMVIASLAVLLGDKRVWMVSVAFGVCCLGQASYTGLHAKGMVEKCEADLDKAEEQFQDFRVRYPDDIEDKAALDAVDPGGVIRKEMEQRAAKVKVPSDTGEK